MCLYADVTVDTYIKDTAEYLLLSMKRFTYDGVARTVRKLATPVSIDRTLTLNAGGATRTFELRGIAQHTGDDADSGHFVAAVQFRRHSSHFWICDGKPCAPEESFSTVPVGDVMDMQPYILLYKQV